MTDGPKQRKTSISLRHEDIAKLAALGMTATEAVRAFCAGRGADGMPVPVQPPGIVLVDDPDQRDPHDVLPDPPPAAGHDWAWTGRWTARAPSLDEAIRLRDEMRGRGGDARIAAPYVLLVAEVSNG